MIFNSIDCCWWWHGIQNQSVRTHLPKPTTIHTKSTKQTQSTVKHRIVQFQFSLFNAWWNRENQFCGICSDFSLCVWILRWTWTYTIRKLLVHIQTPNSEKRQSLYVNPKRKTRIEHRRRRYAYIVFKFSAWELKIGIGKIVGNVPWPWSDVRCVYLYTYVFQNTQIAN